MGMEIIFVSKATPARRRWHLGHWGSVLLLSTVTIVSTGAFYVGYRVASPPAVDPWPDLYAAAVEQVVRAQRYDVDLEGKRFVVVTPVAEAGESPATIRVVQNWFEEFRDREQD